MLSIEGSIPKGIVYISGSKNSALPIICASLLKRGIVVLNKIPRIKDVFVLLDIIKDLNVEYEFNNNTLIVNSTNIYYKTLNIEKIKKIRGSYYLIPVMMILFKRARLLEPGGCRLGERPINYHLNVFKKMGAIINDNNISINKVKNKIIRIPKKSVGTTINALMLSMKNDCLILVNASIEPEVIDFIDFLRKLGRKIYVFKNMIISKKSHHSIGVIEHEIIPDRIEALTYIMISLFGYVKIYGLNPKHIKGELKLLKKSGAGLVIGESSIYAYRRKYKPINVKSSSFPGIATDAIPLFMAYLSSVPGKSILKDNVFKNRFSISSEINHMGGNTIISGKKAIIYGENRLEGKEVKAYDLRCGGGLLILASHVKGFTMIKNEEIIDRGYEDYLKKLRNVGIKIKSDIIKPNI